jgi:parvulin-like peptidyl-prolyl isomerase
MNRNIAVIALLLAAALPTQAQNTDALPSHQPQTTTDSSAMGSLAKPVARVNGAVLTQADLLREMYTIFPYARQHAGGFPTVMEADIRRGALKMIEFEELVYQEAKRRGMTVTPEQVAQAQKQFRKQFSTEQEYQQFLQVESGNSTQILRKKIERSLLIEDLLKIEVTNKSGVSLEEAKAYYDRNLEHFKLPDSYDLQTITIMPPVRPSREQPNPPPPTPDQLKQMRVRAEHALSQARTTKNYEEFGVLAEKISEDDYRVMMGDHKNVAGKDLPPEVLQAASKLQVGQISDLVQAEGAYTIIRLNAHTPARTQSFNELSKNLRAQLREQKTERLRREFDAKLRKGAKIEEL